MRLHLQEEQVGSASTRGVSVARALPSGADATRCSPLRLHSSELCTLQWLACNFLLQSHDNK